MLQSAAPKRAVRRQARAELCAIRAASSNRGTDSEQQHDDRQQQRTDARDEHEQPDNGDSYRWPKRPSHDAPPSRRPLTSVPPKTLCHPIGNLHLHAQRERAVACHGRSSGDP